MYQLSKKTKQALSESIGLPWETITSMTVDEEITYIEKKNGRKLGLVMRPYPNIHTTGNPLLNRYKFTTSEDEEKFFRKLKRTKRF